MLSVLSVVRLGSASITNAKSWLGQKRSTYLRQILRRPQKTTCPLSIARGVMAASVCFDDTGHRLHRPPCPPTSDFAQMRILFPDDSSVR